MEFPNQGTITRNLESLQEVFEFKWSNLTALWKIEIFYLCAKVTFNVSQAYLPFVCVRVLQMERYSIALVPLVSFCGSLVSCLTLKRFIANHKRSLYSGSAILLLIYIFSVWFLTSKTPNFVYFFALLLGIGSGGMSYIAQHTIDSLANTADKHGIGVSTLLDKIITGFVVFILQASNDDSAYFFQEAASLVPGLCSLISLIIIWLPDKRTNTNSEGDSENPFPNPEIKGINQNPEPLVVPLLPPETKLLSSSATGSDNSPIDEWDLLNAEEYQPPTPQLVGIRTDSSPPKPTPRPPSKSVFSPSPRIQSTGRPRPASVVIPESGKNSKTLPTLKRYEELDCLP